MMLYGAYAYGSHYYEYHLHSELKHHQTVHFLLLIWFLDQIFQFLSVIIMNYHLDICSFYLPATKMGFKL